MCINPRPLLRAQKNLTLADAKLCIVYSSSFWLSNSYSVEAIVQLCKLEKTDNIGKWFLPRRHANSVLTKMETMS